MLPDLTDEQLALEVAQLQSWLNPSQNALTGAGATATQASSNPSRYPSVNPSGHSHIPQQTQGPPTPSTIVENPTVQTATMQPVDEGIPSAPPLPEPYSQPILPTPAPAPAEPETKEKPVAAAAVIHEDIDDDDACVVCMSAPKEAGFVHGDSVHRCVCKECAAEVMRQEPRCCPICRQRIDTVLTGFY